jgi:membrane protein
LRRVRTAGQFLYLVGRGFADNRGPIRAAALAYTTLLALVPLLAVGLSLSKSLLHDTSAALVPKLMDQLVTQIAPALEYMPASGQAATATTGGHAVASAQSKREVVAQIQTFIDNINTGALSTIASIALVFIGVRLLMTIEQTFNDIWGITQGRSIWRKVVYYWSAITLGPLLLVGAVYLTGRAEFLGFVQQINVVPGLEKFALRLLPFILLWAGFTLLYALMPNTRVRFLPALAGGIVGGTLWQLNSLLSAMYMSRVMTYSKIYGALGILPIFLLGLYFSWLIILFGAQISFAVQNFRLYFQERAARRIDQQRRELLACRLVLHVCRHYLTGLEPLSVVEWAEQFNAPLQALHQIAQRLIQCGLLCETGDQAALLPARPPESFTVADMLRHLRVEDERSPATLDPVTDVLAKLAAAGQSSPSNLNFRDFALQPATRA